MTDMTTIKVPKGLRDSVMSSARAEGLTAAGLLERVMAEHLRRQRFDAVRDAYARAEPDGDYAEINDVWDEALDDGLADA